MPFGKLEQALFDDGRGSVELDLLGVSRQLTKDLGGLVRVGLPGRLEEGQEQMEFEHVGMNGRRAEPAARLLAEE
jgi:hypothetical protein